MLAPSAVCSCGAGANASCIARETAPARAGSTPAAIRTAVAASSPVPAQVPEFTLSTRAMVLAASMSLRTTAGRRSWNTPAAWPRARIVQACRRTGASTSSTRSFPKCMHIFGALAQYERALTHDRVMAGLAAAKRRGRRGGRPPAIAGEKLDAILVALHGGMSKAAVCRNFGVKRTTLIETLARIGLPAASEAVGE